MLKDTNEVIFEQQAKLLNQSKEKTDVYSALQAEHNDQFMKELKELKEGFQVDRPVEQAVEVEAEAQVEVNEAQNESNEIFTKMSEQQSQLLQEV